MLDPRYLRFVGNSLTLAGVAAVVTVAGAILVGFRARIRPGRRSRALVMAAGLGYAVPGGVIAVGLLVPFAGLDNLIDGWARAHLGISTGLLFTGSIWLLVLAYMARFMAVALNTFDAGLATVSPRIDAVARTLGRRPPAVLGRVHLPILKGSVLTAILIVFVDTMKELPATLIMRPFDFDTLAVQAHRLAADERLDAAAVPSLVIAAIGLLPVILLCRAIAAEGRPAPPSRARPSAGRAIVSGGVTAGEEVEPQAWPWTLVICGYFLFQALYRRLLGGGLLIDEAQMLLWSRELAWGYGPQPPLYSWLQWATFAAVPDRLLALALLKNACSR